MDKELTPEIINRYLAGEASSGEIAIVNNWFDGLKNKPSLISALSPAKLEQLSARMFSKISKALDDCTADEIEKPDDRDHLKKYSVN